MQKKCFGSNRQKRCTVLNVSKCEEEKCSFFKTNRTIAEDRKRVNRMLVALPNVEQKHISEKYYNGKMPWSNQNGYTFTG